MDGVSQEVPVIGGCTDCGCLVFVASIPDGGQRLAPMISHPAGEYWRDWSSIKAQLREQAAAGLELRIITRARVSQFNKCPHAWETKPKPKDVKYDSSLIAARDGVIAAVEVMMRLRGWGL